ncbi:MAG: glycosyltransferase [Alphaproteobacteria bacterium]|nr:glycosyltransferase [Alphaproteobacteria bacterium]
MKLISVVTPCFNEEDNVEECYRTVSALFAERLPNYRLEHVFADNCSTDRTPEILRGLAQKDPRVKVILNARNFGPLRSTFNALRYASGDAVVVLLPADMQDPPELITDFVRHWENGYEIVAGARTQREESFLMQIGRGAFYRIVNALSDFEISPNVGEFQLVDKKVLAAVLSFDDRYPYIRGMLASVGFKRIQVDYTWRARKRGVSWFNLPRLIDQAFNGIFAFTRAPLRLCTMAGFAIAALCLLFTLISIAVYFLNPSAAPRGVTTLIVAIFFLSSVQLIFIGILGEYVTSIHAQVRGGPIVIERERFNIDEEPATR